MAGSRGSSLPIGDPEFESLPQVKQYLDTVRKVTRHASAALDAAGAELEAALASTPGTPGLFGADSKVRARLVARHLDKAAEHQRAVAASAVRCWGAVRRHFAAEIQQANGHRKPTRRTFNWKE
ncbi:hypothetical protein [Cryptosporangium japonicum]|uniref:Uncharacterized protein n=1 Tax=Cryptosporangium japonicum TaxID=80872 RepID=A0ABN0UMR2_9ACTN